jgi:hypothetical protein
LIAELVDRPEKERGRKKGYKTKRDQNEGKRVRRGRRQNWFASGREVGWGWPPFSIPFVCKGGERRA